jgi:cellulose synthase/poly-beta-1,6-N-acetylglucosamine synthase-like glycosyltransferase
MVVPPNWSFSVVSRYFADKNVLGLAFTLAVSNRDGYLSEAQNLEYLVAGSARAAHAHLGSALFASGGFAAYRTAALREILEHHTGMFQGEDLRIGLLQHTLFPGSKIGVCEEIVVSTAAPVHFVHQQGCACGEPSMYHQRVHSWEIARYWFFPLFARTVWFGRTSIVRVVCLIEMLQILNDHAAIVYAVVAAVLWPASLARGLVLCVSWTTPFLVLACLVVLRSKIDWFTVLTFSLFYKSIYFFVRIAALVYFYGWFLLGNPRHPPIGQRAADHAAMA